MSFFSGHNILSAIGQARSQAEIQNVLSSSAMLVGLQGQLQNQGFAEAQHQVQMQDRSTFLDRNFGDERLKFAFEQQKKEEARRAELFNVILPQLKNILGSQAPDLGAGVPTIDTSIRQEDVNGLISQIEGALKGPTGGQQTALREQGQRGIDQQFLSAQRDLRSLNSRATPSLTASAQASDLIRERLRSRSDLEQGLIVDDLNRRDSLMSLMNNVVGGDIQRRFGGEQVNVERGLNLASLADNERARRVGLLQSSLGKLGIF